MPIKKNHPGGHHCRLSFLFLIIIIALLVSNFVSVTSVSHSIPSYFLLPTKNCLILSIVCSTLLIILNE